MKIRLIGSGGFAGLAEEHLLDTQDPPTPSRMALEGLLDAVHFFDAPAAVPGAHLGADIMTWKISVTDGERRKTVTYFQDGSAAAEPWQNLVNRMLEAE